VTVTAPARRSARSTGWRPRGPWDICSLGWEILEWTSASLPDPSDPTLPLVLTDTQARRVLRIYEIDPVSGRRLYDRVHQEEAKGWGKGPLAAMLALGEFGGAPVLFDGWDADGQPVGIPWGSPGTLTPYVQVVSVSEANTFNVWQMVMILSGGARGPLAHILTVDSGRPGRTMLRRRDIPGAEMGRATASAASRTGAPLVHAVLDEVQGWLPENGGPELAATVMFNLDKTGGWGHFLANAPVIDHGSVAETWGKSGPRVLMFATRPSEEPHEDWSVERKRVALAEVYRDVPWMLDKLDRQVDSLSLADDGQGVVPWGKVLREKFNVRGAENEEAWMPDDLWAACTGDAALVTDEPVYICVRVGHHHRAAAVAVAQRQGERVILRSWAAEVSEGEYVDAESIETYIEEHHIYRAHVLAMVQKRPGGKPTKRRRHGPLLLHHEAFFEPSRQRLERAGMVTMGVPSSQERLTPAAETLMQAVTSGILTHDGDPELVVQMGRLMAKQKPRGWAIESGTGEPIVAAQAAMLAVHWAMTVEKPRAGSGAATY
jgi:hypothetical protein